MEGVNAEMLAARAKLRERFGDGTRIGGKGGARMKKRPVTHKSNSGDDKKLQATIKRIGLSQLPGVDEVAMIKEDGQALCFSHPKVQAAINANTFILTGAAEEKRVDQLFTLPPDIDPEMLKKFAAEWQKMQESNAASAGGAKDSADAKDDDEDDDEVPTLVDDFEAVATARDPK